MLYLSEILMQQHDMSSFNDLLKFIRKKAEDGEIFFQADVAPPFKDTPSDWEIRLENAFTGVSRS
jgi:hypothetical protein